MHKATECWSLNKFLSYRLIATIKLGMRPASSGNFPVTFREMGNQINVSADNLTVWVFHDDLNAEPLFAVPNSQLNSI